MTGVMWLQFNFCFTVTKTVTIKTSVKDLRKREEGERRKEI